MPETQYRILNETQYFPRLDRIPLASIRGDTLFPEPQFLESVRNLGVIQPIVVIAGDDYGTYDLVAGRRRVAALRELVDQDDAGANGLIPALIFPEGTPRSVAAAMTLTENTQRRTNPLTDLESIEEMLEQGASLEDIARQLYIPLGTVRARMALGSLLPELRQALRDGLMAPGVAQSAARLPRERQLRLLQPLRENGRIRHADVGALLFADQQEQIDALPNSIFINTPAPAWEIRADTESETVTIAPAPAVELPTEHTWAGVLRCLDRAAELLPVAVTVQDEQISLWLTDIIDMVRGRANATT